MPQLLFGCLFGCLFGHAGVAHRAISPRPINTGHDAACRHGLEVFRLVWSHQQPQWTRPLVRNAVEHFRVVCSLGLPREEALISITEAARAVVPANFGRMSLFDAKGVMVSGYNENPLNQIIVAEHFDELSKDPLSPLALVGPAWTANACGVYLDRAAAYAESLFYAECERPSDVHSVLDIMAADGGPPVAGLHLTRARSQKPFTRDNLLRLKMLAPFIAHALRERPRPDAEVDTALTRAGVRLSGNAMISADGIVSHLTPGFRQLAMMADNHFWIDPRLPLRSEMSLPASFRAILRRLPRNSWHSDDAPARSVIRTAWGYMRIEATLIVPNGVSASDAAAGAAGLAALLRAELLEHPAAAAVRNLRASGASPVQVAVGLRLALGRRKKEIARDLGVSPSSVEDAARKLYARLNVHNAAELGAQLWAGAIVRARP